MEYREDIAVLGQETLVNVGSLLRDIKERLRQSQEMWGPRSHVFDPV